MAYRIENITQDEATERAMQYPYALVYKMSEIYLGKTAGIENSWDEMLEARFFSEKSEMHIFRREKQWKTVVVTDDEDTENSFVRRYELANKFLGAGKYIAVKHYLADDEDGQVYVEQTRLCGITGGNSDGI